MSEKIFPIDKEKLEEIIKELDDENDDLDIEE